MENNKKHRALTPEEIKEGCIKISGSNGSEAQVCVVQEELRQGIEMVENHENSVTFYGSARLGEDNEFYKKAQNLAHRISTELGYAVMSGGGPGIMEAANRGADEAMGKSVGLTIRLPNEQVTNKYVNEEIPFYFFFTRRVAMFYMAKACIFFPGGFGTFDEFFEMVTMKQTGKVGDIPLICVGSEFWNPVNDLVKNLLVEKHGTVYKEEMDLYYITDSEDEILEIIKNSKIREGNSSLK